MLTALIAVAATVAGVTAAADAGPTKARAKAKTTLKVLACQTGEGPSERFATFHGRMRPFKHTRRMLMRFTLIERAPDGASPVEGPRQLTRWHRSRPHVSSFGIKKTVTGLQPGLSYRAAVTYRWKRRGGRKTVSVRRWSALCHQDGDLPNLTVGRTTARTGLAAGTEIYSVPVTNTGKAEARSVTVDLVVDSAHADAQQIDVLGPGETRTVEISGPSCRGHVRSVVDPDDEIAETTEDDNSRRRRCPAVTR